MILNMILAIWLIIATVGFIYLAAHYNFWRLKVSNDYPRILMYHSINHNPGISHPDLVVTPANFKAQLQYLKKNHYQFLTVSELITGQQASYLTPVALTFDDGFADNYTHMFPLLKEFNAKATIFLCPDMPKINKLTNQQIQEMQASGLVEFGAHTMTHLNLALASDDIAQNEIRQSKQHVESITGVTCNSFAYPYGRFNERTANYVKNAGFLCAVTVKKGIEALTNAYMIKRISVLGKTNIVQFHIAMTRGRYRV